jgi:transposase
MRRAIAIALEDAEREKLERLKRGRCVPVRLAERAAIVLHAAEGLEDQKIGVVMGITRQKAGRWRKRYARLGLAGIEKDAPRPGCKRRIDEQKRAAVVHKTLHETPEDQACWSRTAMARATGLSESTVGRIWKEHGLNPRLIAPSPPSPQLSQDQAIIGIVGNTAVVSGACRPGLSSG